MPDSAQTEAQAATVTTPAPQATSAQAAALGTPQAGVPADEALTFKDAKKLRKENKALREKFREIEEKARKLEEEKLSDNEKVARERDSLKEANERLQKATRKSLRFYAVALEAQKLGIVDPEAAAALIKPKQLEYDDDGRPTNVGQLLQELIAEKPYLKAPTAEATPPSPAPTPSAGAPTNPPTQNPSNPNSSTAPNIRSFEDYQKADKALLWESIRNGTYGI